MGLVPAIILQRQFDHVGGSMLFRLPVMIVDALKCFGTYNFAQRTGSDPVLTTVEIH